MRSFLPLIRAEWPLLLFGFSMMFCSSFGQTFFIGLFSGAIREDLGLSHGDFGAIYSAATLASAVVLVWSGALIDRLDLRLYTCLVALGLALGCVMLALSHGPVMLLLAIFALRHLGQGLLGLSGPTATMRYLTRERGKGNALVGMGYSLGEALLPSIAIGLLAWLSWRQSWLAWGALVLVLAPLLSLWTLREQGSRHASYLQALRDEAGNPAQGVQRQWTRSEVIRDPLLYMFLPALLAQPMLFTGFIFHQVQLVEEKHWDLGAWAQLFVFYAFVNVICKLFSGVLIDRFGAVRAAPLVCLPMGLGLLVLGMSDSFLAAWGFMGLMAVSVGAYSTLSSPFYSEMYGTLHLGSIKSFTAATMVFATAVAPLAMGWLIDLGVSLASMAFIAAAYTVLASLLARSAARRWQRSSAAAP